MPVMGIPVSGLLSLHYSSPTIIILIMRTLRLLLSSPLCPGREADFMDHPEDIIDRRSTRPYYERAPEELGRMARAHRVF